MLAAVMPLPRLLATPPVTKTYFDMGQGSSGVFLMLQKSGPRRESGWYQGQALLQEPDAGRLEVARIAIPTISMISPQIRKPRS